MAGSPQPVIRRIIVVTTNTTGEFVSTTATPAPPDSRSPATDYSTTVASATCTMRYVALFMLCLPQTLSTQSQNSIQCGCCQRSKEMLRCARAYARVWRVVERCKLIRTCVRLASVSVLWRVFHYVEVQDANASVYLCLMFQ